MEHFNRDNKEKNKMSQKKDTCNYRKILDRTCEEIRTSNKSERGERSVVVRKILRKSKKPPCYE